MGKLVRQEVLSLRLQNFYIFHNLFNNIRISLCDSKDILLLKIVSNLIEMIHKVTLYF
jgi:hypothetical protein